MSDMESNLKEKLLHFARKNVNLDYHELSNTHIAYCMAIGRQGVKGFGHTADIAFDRFMQQLGETVSDAPSTELSYWSKRCDLAMNAALKRAELENLTRESLSGQIGMSVPAVVQKAVSENAQKLHISRNQLVTDLLSGGYERLEKRLENEPSKTLREEIKRQSGKGEESWSQHVTPDLQARLMLLARRFEISVAMLSRYLLVKSHQDSENLTAKRPSKAMVAGALQPQAPQGKEAKIWVTGNYIPIQNQRASPKVARTAVGKASDQLTESPKNILVGPKLRGTAKKQMGPTKGKAFAAARKK